MPIFKPSKILGLFLKSFIWHHLVKLRCLLLPDAYKLHQLHFAKFNGLNKDFIEPNRFTQGWCQTPSLVSVSMHLPALCLSMDPLRSKVSLHLSDTSDPASTDSRLLGHGEIQEEIKGAGLMRTGPDLLHKPAKTLARCLTAAAMLNQLKSRLDSRSAKGFYAVVKSGILTTERRGVYEACMPNPISVHAFHLFSHNRGLENYMCAWNLVTGL